MRPVLLIDVDGVLNPIAASPPPGFKRLEQDGFIFSISEQHGLELVALRKVFEIVWASTWEESANRSIGPALSLPELPFIDLSGPRSGMTWKLGPVSRFVGDRPLVWIDDELYDDAFDWASRREARTLPIKPNSSVGMRSGHFEQIREFGGSHRSSESLKWSW